MMSMQQDLDENTVTDAVLEQMSHTPNARLKFVMEALVKHLHDFAREVDLTPEEWLYGIGFITQIGQTCTPSRQETILLSDTLGLSALVNALHAKKNLAKATDPSLLGPFYRAAAPVKALGDSIAAVPDQAPEIAFYGQIQDSMGRGIPHAELTVWQTDAEGYYDMQLHGEEQMDHRAIFTADAHGNFHFRAVRPLGYYIPMDGPVGAMINAQLRHGCRPAHTHFLISAPGHAELVTSLYFGDDQYIGTDTVFGVSTSLIIEPKQDANSPMPNLPSVHYVFTLSPANADGGGRVGADPSQLVKA
jgi:protocatechuate 3,4-dioxygenase beta subunit